jgi:hypothetical protein
VATANVPGRNSNGTRTAPPRSSEAAARSSASTIAASTPSRHRFDGQPKRTPWTPWSHPLTSGAAPSRMLASNGSPAASTA